MASVAEVNLLLTFGLDYTDADADADADACTPGSDNIITLLTAEAVSVAYTQGRPGQASKK